MAAAKKAPAKKDVPLTPVPLTKRKPIAPNLKHVVKIR